MCQKLQNPSAAAESKPANTSDRFSEIMHIVMVLTTVWVPDEDQPIMSISPADLEATHEAGRELVKLTAAILTELQQRKLPL